MPLPVDVLNNNRRTVRSPVNPMDISTVVSIFPIALEENKSTMQPGLFRVPPGSYEKPAILRVGSSSWWRDAGPDDNTLIEIPVNSFEVARSIVEDYVKGLIGFTMGVAAPGIFFVPGNFDEKTIRAQHQVRLDDAKKKQTKWYQILIDIADKDWARTGGNPLCIAATSKLAAEQLGAKDKPWMKEYSTTERKPCPACGELWNPIFPVCVSCKTIVDHKKYEQMKLAQAT